MMDDETAEIELLQQNLHKTRQLSKRMTTILDSFDTRIAKLEKSIHPLYHAAQVTNRRRTNIEKALAKIEDMATTQGDLSTEESLILRGPQPGQLRVYTEALERLNASIAFKGAGNNDDTEKMASLVETGAKKLTQLYTKYVAEGSSGSSSLAPATPSTSPASFPDDLLSTLSPLVAFLRTLPLPATHPSHPAAPSIQKTLSDAWRGYADMRGSWAVKCLDSQGKRVVVRASESKRERDNDREAGRLFGEWVQEILACAEEEYKLLQLLCPLPFPATAPQSPSSPIPAAFSALLTPILRLFNSVLSSLVTLSKKDLVKYSFLALSAYESLLSLQVHWEDVIGRTVANDGSKAKDKNEFKEGLAQLKQLCLRSFPEFMADLRMGATARSGNETSVALASFTIETVNYISKIPEVQGAVASALIALGNGVWNMGAGGAKVGQAEKLGEGDEALILENYLHDLLSTALTSLTTISTNPALRRPVYGSIFLLNNVAYIRSRLLIGSGTREVPAMFSSATRDLINSNYRTARAGYFDANFSPLIQTLSEDRNDSKSGGKTAAKEKFTKFFDLFDEVIERHRVAKVFGSVGGLPSATSEEEEAEERYALGSEVISLVIPTLQRFIQKQKDRDFSKNPGKYIRRTPEDVEAQIRSVFA